MKRTLTVGLIGFFLVGGFVTSLYLINRPTNPPSSAAEIVNVVNPPDDNQNNSGGGIVAPTISESSNSGAAVFSDCEKLYGLKEEDAGYVKNCDFDENGIINVIDLQKIK